MFKQVLIRIVLMFIRIFAEKPKADSSVKIPWEDAVEMLYDKHLDAFADKIVDVIYSKDRSMRYVILEKNNGLLTYQLEAIYSYNGEKWGYVSLQDNSLAAMWEPFRGIVEKSVFGNMDELTKELHEEPEYKQYFELKENRNEKS